MPEETLDPKDLVEVRLRVYVDGMLKLADEILSLAVEHTDHEKTLAACATIILAAAIDQEVKGQLRFGNITETPYAELLKNGTSLWKQMEGLPKVLSDGKYQLDPNSRYVQRLHDLISWRNKLLHIEDEVYVLKLPWEQVIKGEDGSLKLFIPGKSPEFPWGKITVEQARGFREAVGAYFEEVVNRKTDELSSGKIICKVPERRMSG